MLNHDKQMTAPMNHMDQSNRGLELDELEETVAPGTNGDGPILGTIVGIIIKITMTR